MSKKILFLDMDGVVADFEKGIKSYCPDLEVSDKFPNVEERSILIDEVMASNPNMFLHLDPIPEAIDYSIQLFDMFEVYFLSVPCWHVPQSFTDKRLWLEKHFGKLVERRLILSHRKDLAIGHYLVDDRLHHGAKDFQGKHIHFGTEKFPDWKTTFEYLKLNK